MSHSATTEPLMLDEIAERCGELRVASERLFELVRSWAATVEDDRSAVALSTVSRHLGEHATWWASHEPESVLLATRVEAGTARPLAAAVDELALLAPDPAGLGSLNTVVGSLADAVATLAAACDAESGAPFRRVARWVTADLENALATLEPT